MADKQVIIESTEKLVEKWTPVIECKDQWADRIGDAPKVQEKDKANMALVLENLEQLVLKENTVAGDAAVWNPILIPLVRRITPSLVGPEMFGTQPMKSSNGLIFYLRSLYTGVDADNLKYGPTQSALLVLNTNTGLVVGATVTDGTNTGTVKYVETQGDLFFALVSGATFNVSETAVGCTIAGTYTGTISTVYSNEANFEYILKNYSGPLSTSITAPGVSGYTSSLYETFSTQNEMGFNIESQSVVARKRMLKARWSREVEEDLKNAHNLNAEQILTSMCSEEIVREMNREFVGLIDAQTTLTNTNYFTVSYGGLDGRWEGEKYQNVCAIISRLKRKVGLRNRRGQANFMVCSPLAVSILESTGKLSTDGVDVLNQYAVGNFMGMKVFCDIYANDTYPTMWLGYKGSEVDAGLFYCPYVPLRVDKGISPDDNTPRIFFTTRYATAENQFGANRFFSKVIFTGFPQYTVA